MTPEEFEEYLHEAVHQLMDLNDQCMEEFGISKWERWDYDLDAATLTFSENKVPRVVASIVVVGSTSSNSNTWLWAWANESIPKQASERLAEVLKFGESEQIDALTIDRLEDDEHLGWELTAVAARILKAKGAYRCPSERGFLYVAFTDVMRVQ